MPVYFVTGKLGNGKGLYCAMKAAQYYKSGRRVAANYPLDTFAMDPTSKESVTIVPAHPRRCDFDTLGRGCPEGEYDNFGALFLDEAATWLNSRTYADKERLKLLDWFIHSRKMGWDVFIQIQSEDLVDKQIAASTGEHLVICKRLDRLRIPFLTSFLEAFFPKKYGATGKRRSLMPLYISAKTYFQKQGAKDKPINSEYFKGSDSFGIYDTNFVFTDGKELLKDGDSLKEVDMRSTYSLLSGSKLKDLYHNANYSTKKNKSKGGLKTLIYITLCISSMYYSYSHFFGKNDEAILSGKSLLISGDELESVKKKKATPVIEKVNYPISEKWRIRGYFKNSKGMPYVVLTDTNKNQRITPLSAPWNSYSTAFVFEGEWVSFYSGNSTGTKKEIKGITDGMGDKIPGISMLN